MGRISYEAGKKCEKFDFRLMSEKDMKNVIKIEVGVVFVDIYCFDKIFSRKPYKLGASSREEG